MLFGSQGGAEAATQARSLGTVAPASPVEAPVERAAPPEVTAAIAALPPELAAMLARRPERAMQAITELNDALRTADLLARSAAAGGGDGRAGRDTD